MQLAKPGDTLRLRPYVEISHLSNPVGLVGDLPYGEPCVIRSVDSRGVTVNHPEVTHVYHIVGSNWAYDPRWFEGYTEEPHEPIDLNTMF